MSLRSKWQKLSKRKWEVIRDSWLANIPIFPSIGSRPDPGLERLEPLLQLDLPKDNGRLSDVPGLRTLTLWEAVFLFHKCAYTNLAAQRLGHQGMHSWCLFNAYHSAYLGAKGIMALLGIAFPNIKGNQIVIDLFPEDERRKHSRILGSLKFNEVVIVHLPMIEQRFLWEGFQRILRTTDAECWNSSIRNELLKLSYEDITPPRNHFLYKVHFWPLNDLINDVEPSDLNNLCGTALDADDKGFLLRLSFSVYHLFEQLIVDFAQYSSVIKEQYDGSRFLSNSILPELNYYHNFLSQINASAQTPI